MLKRRKQTSEQRNNKRSRQSQAEKPDMQRSGLEEKLPLELQLAVLECLEKKHLKQVRLISQRWCSLAIPLLFNKLYISCRSLDLRYFRECAAHPVISQAIKELVYDISHFQADMSLETYFDRLTRDCIVIFGEKKPFERPNQPFHHYINALISEPFQWPNLRSCHENDAFIQEGYISWLGHARHEESAFSDELLFTILCYGLRKFVNLRSVIVEGNIFGANIDESMFIDRSTLRCEYSGSPTTRNWNPLHARPDADNYEPDILDRHFRTLTLALDATRRMTGRTIHDLRLLVDEDIYSGLPVTTLQSTTVDRKLYRASDHAYNNLKSFAIRVIALNQGDFTSPEGLGILPDMLVEMKDLENLEVDLRRWFNLDLSYDIRYHTLQQLFPFDIWPNLVSLSLSGLSTKATDLLDLLSIQLPKLRRLSLTEIELLDGHWEGMIAVMNGVGLREFTLQGYHPCLTYRGRLMFEAGKPNTEYTHVDFFNDIEHYVVHGGRHPCLPPNSESRASLYYALSMIAEKDRGRYQTLFKGNGVDCPSDPGSIARLTPLPSKSRI